MAVTLVGKRARVVSTWSSMHPLVFFYQVGEVVTITAENPTDIRPLVLCVNEEGKEQVVPTDCLRYLNNAPVTRARTSYEAQQKAKLEQEG